MRGIYYKQTNSFHFKIKECNFFFKKSTISLCGKLYGLFRYRVEEENLKVQHGTRQDGNFFFYYFGTTTRIHILERQASTSSRSNSTTWNNTNKKTMSSCLTRNKKNKIKLEKSKKSWKIENGKNYSDEEVEWKKIQSLFHFK